MGTQYDIFICYRRDGGAETAKHLRDVLAERGYRVFFDTDSLRSGDFNRALFDVIEGCTDFIIILSPGSLDRCSNEGDWVRQELSWALSKGKNVIPIMSKGFEFPDSLPPDINDVRWKNGIVVNVEYFDAMIDKLVTFLLSKRSVRKRSVLPLVAATALGVAVGAALLWFFDGGTSREEGAQTTAEVQAVTTAPQDDEGADAQQDVEPADDPQPEAAAADDAGDVISNDEYILPESDTRYYTREELEQLSDWELWMARNELYARHGRKFKNQEVQDYFYGKSWYEGLYEPNEYDTAGVPKVYNDYERRNRALIEQIEAERNSPYAD